MSASHSHLHRQPGFHPGFSPASRSSSGGTCSWFHAFRSASTVEVVAPLTFRFADDGVIPNNPALPLVLYRRAIDVRGASDPAATIERLFETNYWGDSWRDGIFGYPHYHSNIHEVLGIARGHARVRFGGAKGADVDLRAGDVAILPAGTGHQRLLASEDLLVVGAYPPSGNYDLCRESPNDHARALVAIPKTPRPHHDPVYGRDGPLLRLWRA